MQGAANISDFLQYQIFALDCDRRRRESKENLFHLKGCCEGEEKGYVLQKFKLTAGPCALAFCRGFPLMESIPVTQDTSSCCNTLLTQKPCACQWKPMSETVLGTVVASFRPSSCIACAQERAAGVVKGITLGNAPEQDEFALFTRC